MPLAPTVPAIRVAVASTGNPGASGSLVSSVTVWDKQALRKVKKKLKPGIFPSIVEQLNYRSVPSKRPLTVLGLPLLPSGFLQPSPARPDSRGAAESQPRPSLGRTPGDTQRLWHPAPRAQPGSAAPQGHGPGTLAAGLHGVSPSRVLPGECSARTELPRSCSLSAGSARHCLPCPREGHCRTWPICHGPIAVRG